MPRPRAPTLSFSGIVTFKNADDVRAAAAITPRDRMLVETDSPYLAPVPHRGQPNRPAWVGAVGEGLAAARAESVKTVADATRANARRLFRAPERRAATTRRFAEVFGVTRRGRSAGARADGGRPPDLPDTGIEIDPPGGRR